MQKQTFHILISFQKDLMDFTTIIAAVFIEQIFKQVVNKEGLTNTKIKKKDNYA